MSPTPKVVLALSPRAERHLEAVIFDSDAPLELAATTLEADELLRAVAEREVDAVLLSHDFSGLTAAHCERVRASGARLIGVAANPRDGQALDALGVETTIEPSVSREQLRVALSGSDTPPPEPTSAAASRRERGEGDGTVLAVIGSKGAPGSSECAASLAALASQRWETLLIEADALGGGLSLRLGADPGEGSILGLIRATQAGEGALPELLERWRCEREGWPAVLLGDAHALAEHTSEPGSITRALDALAREYPLVACDVGFLLDARQPAARAHREVLVNADAVLLVLGASEAQLRDGLRQLDVILETLAIAPERLLLIVNGLGGPSSTTKDVIGATIATRVIDTGVTIDAWLPWDVRGARRARRAGLPIAHAHRRSRYTKALAGLLDEMFLPDMASSKAKRRKRRLPVPGALRRTPLPQTQYGEEEVALPWQT